MYKLILKYACAILMVGSIGITAKAQDLIYSQFYNAPVYLNPALNGEFEGDIRFNMIYRSQWTKVRGALDSYTFSVDYQLPAFGGGIGLILNKSTEGTAYLSKLNVASVFSYSVQLNSESRLSFGLQAGMINSRVDESRLLFSDQLDNQGIIPGATSSASILSNNNRSFFDAAAGINLVAGNFMIGGSAQHINRPDESLTGQVSKLPMRYGIHTSYLISLDRYGEELPAIIPSLVVYRQDQYNSISAGFQFKTSSINLGLWYRGNGSQNDAIVFSVIFDLFKNSGSSNKVRLGVSHDATTSKLNYTTTGGTTEAAVVYETEIPGRAEARYIRERNNSFNRCYKFY
ncbi:PorP/SprF family type IX secretion system membrane protein [Pedobacter xixiisoli]|uniref:Type IX secretion system membrane protein, PorP/SprF family n=1 Tax=Pedobacter xixiisoli TaxID=1476464 RepID=A0A285ZQB6_9SPHI|nr:PorP/SprF family type IX secretion system membrane protein [Pedobacter xixiisoli]SOD11849.1 type IX secretion system membrane protein, PorP/SprF family [Pedobacter xixiisoli]